MYDSKLSSTQGIPKKDKSSHSAVRSPFNLPSELLANILLYLSNSDIQSLAVLSRSTQLPLIESAKRTELAKIQFFSARITENLDQKHQDEKQRLLQACRPVHYLNSETLRQVKKSSCNIKLEVLDILSTLRLSVESIRQLHDVSSPFLPALFNDFFLILTRYAQLNAASPWDSRVSIYDLSIQLSKNGGYDQALRVLNLFGACTVRDNALIKIVPMILREHDVEKATQFAFEIQRVYAGGALLRVCNYLLAQGNIDKAIKIADAMPNCADHGTAELNIVEKMAKSGQINRAIQQAQKDDNPFCQCERLSKIVAVLTYGGEFEEARAVVQLYPRYGFTKDKEKSLKFIEHWEKLAQLNAQNSKGL